MKRTYDTPLFNTAKMNKHTYYCSNDNCTNETDYNGGLCHEHMESLSHESSECPGCGNDIYCGANGYCSNCWNERFGCESPIEHDCTNVFDHEIGQWTCGNAPAHKCSGEWDYDRGIRECDDEEYHRKNCECKHSPLCKLCESYYGYDDSYDGVKCDFPHKCTNVFDHEIGQWTCGNQDAHMHQHQRRNSIESHYERSCASCHENFTSKTQTRCCDECHIDAAVVIQKWWRAKQPFAWCNLWFQGHCRSCKSYFPTQSDSDVHCPECKDSIKLPNLPPSPTDEIEEKLRQTSLSCDGCRDDVLNQQGHMHPGGCLYIPCHECGNSKCCCSPSEAD